MSEKSGESRPLIGFLSRLCDIIVVNLLLDVLYLTVVGSGAALAAVYGVFLKWTWGDDVSPIKDLIHGVKTNFISTFPATLLLFVDITALAIADRYLFEENLLFDPVLWVALAVFALLLTVLLSWLFPLMGRFDNTFRGHLKNACILSLKCPKMTLLITAVNLMPLLVVTAFPPYLGFCVGFWGFVGLAGGAYINSYYLRSAFESIHRSNETEGMVGRFE